MIKVLLRIEYGLAFILLFIIYWQCNFSLWLFIILLLVPDITMIGYLINTRIGSMIYNIGHSFILPILLLGISLSISNEFMMEIVLIWIAHILMDRFFGFGLKYAHSFKETHLQHM